MPTLFALVKRYVAKNGLDNNSQTIINVADPVNATDAATKNYTDTVTGPTIITAKALTGFVAGAGTVGAGDTILSAIQKLAVSTGNVSGVVAIANGGTGNSTGTVANATVAVSTPMHSVTDSRAVTTTPETKNQGAYFDFKTNAAEALVDGGTYFGEMTLRPWGVATDWTGALAHQLGFTDNGNIWQRAGSSVTWGAWKKLLDSANFNTYSPTLIGTGASGTWPIAITRNAATVTTNANLTGEVISVGNATTIVNASVIGKVLTGFVAGTGIVAATDTILTALQKHDANITLAQNTANSANTLTTSTNTALTTEVSRATTAEALLVPKTTTVNGHALSSAVVVTAADVGLGLVSNTADATKSIGGTAANVTGVVAVLNGGTGATTAATGRAALGAAASGANTDITSLTSGVSIPGMLASVGNGLTAVGTNQATALLIASDYNVITASAVGTGVVMPNASAGKNMVISNISTNPIVVYPAVGQTFDALAANAGITIPANGLIHLFAASATAWVTSYQATMTASGLSYYVLTAAGAGTTQATAYVLPTQSDLVNISTASGGILLPSNVSIGKKIVFICNVAGSVNIYPPVGGTINFGTANIPRVVSTGAIVAFTALTQTTWLADGNGFNGTNGVLQEYDKGTIATGTVTFTAYQASVQKLTVGGALTIALTGFNGVGIYNELVLELVNGGAFVVTMPTINWMQPTGVTTTIFSTYLTTIGRAALNTTGVDFIYLWTTNAGTTIYGKIM